MTSGEKSSGCRRPPPGDGDALGGEYGRADGDALSAWQHLADMLDITPHRAGEFFGEVLARLDGDDAALREVRTRSTLAQLVE